MLRLLFFTLFFCSGLFSSQTLDLAHISSSQTTKKYHYCVIDTNNSFSFESILEKKDIPLQKKSNMGYLHHLVWCKLEVTNSSSELKEFIFSNARAGMDSIDLRVYKNGAFKEYSLGDMVNPKDRTQPSLFSNFKLSLGANQSATIITRYKNIGNMEAGWKIDTIESYTKNELLNLVIVIGMAGFFIAMMLYKFVIYLHIRDKVYLVYALAISTIFISQASLHGITYYFFYEYIDLFTITLSIWVFTHLFLVFLWIFTLMFFNIDRSSRFYYPLMIVIIYNIAVTLFYASAFFGVESLKYTSIIALIALIESILLLLFSIAMYFYKKPGSGYFLIGHFLYIAAVFQYISTLQGDFELTILQRHISGFGIFIVVLFMSISLSRKFKTIKEETKKLKEKIEENKQFVTIGSTIAYVSHQWKQPLSVMGHNVASIMADIDHKPHLKIETLKPKIELLEQSIVDINNIDNDIRLLFSNNKNIDKKFNLLESITSTQKSLETQLIKNNIQLNIDLSQDILIYGNSNLFSQVLINIVQNSIDAFDDSIHDRYININAKSDEKNRIILTLEDNAGGIKIEPIEDVFKTQITNKIYGKGIGLVLAKNIIETKFSGELEVENTKIGAKFKISFCLPKT